MISSTVVKFLQIFLIVCFQHGQILVLEGRRLDGQRTGESDSVESMCGHPASKANSQTNLAGGQESFPVGTTTNYSCDPGFYLFGDDVRSCQLDGTWSGEAPRCMKKVSYGKSVNCTGKWTCDRTNNVDGLQWLVDNKEDTCHPLPSGLAQSTDSHGDQPDTFQWTIDLMEEFQRIGAFRFVFHGKSRDIPVVRISTESSHRQPIALQPTECSITQRELDLDYEEIVIRPNVMISARFVHLFIKIRNSDDKTGFCEAEVYAEDAPAVHQCFDADDIDGSEQSREYLKMTLTYDASCYTFDGRASNPWATANQRCIVTNDGQLARQITPHTKTVLTTFVKSKSLLSHYWIGGRTQKEIEPGRKGYKVVWQWSNGKNIDSDLWNPREESGENQCLGFNAPSGVLLMYPCYSYTGAICETAIKRCSSPERNVAVKVEVAAGGGGNHVGATITHSCSHGYTLFGDRGRQCLPSGKWSGSPARCIHNDITEKQNLEMTQGGLIGIIIAGIVVGLLLILIVLTVIIVKRRGSFKKTLHFKKTESGESVETLDSKEELKESKDKECLTQKPQENYQSLNQQEEQHQVHEK